MKRVLITGGAGFIGHHLVEHLLKNTDWNIVVLDKLNYASSGLDRLRDIDCFNIQRVLILSSDFARPLEDGIKQEIGNVDYIIHMGAETHVDKSIENAEPFVMSNVVGTMHMLEFARTLPNLEKFVMFSTDEVYGPAPEGVAFKETDRYNSTNPYAGTKAGAECLCVAYANSYGLPIVITNTMNVMGNRQNPEKMIPLAIKRSLTGELVEIHANADRTKAGSRFYIHARNVSDAVLFILQKTNELLSAKVPGQGRFNIVGEQEIDNLSLLKFIYNSVKSLKDVPPLNYQLVDFHSSRPGHDLRYALCGDKLKDLGWTVPKSFEASLTETIEWTLNRPEWLGLK